MGAPEFRRNASPGSTYSASQVTAWLRRLGLPTTYQKYVDDPTAIPKSYEALELLFKSQITVFPYENLTVHYSSSHLVNIKPELLYSKMMDTNRGRGGYCMELSIFFHHMLRGLGFRVIMTGVRNRTRTDGVPDGEYQGWTHINNIIYLPDGTKYSADVAFGGDGPTAPLPMYDDARIHQNLGSQQVRLVHDNIDKQQLTEPRLWIYQYRNGQEKQWNSFYSFAELEFFQEDFEVQNWWACAHTLHRWTVLVVRFLREGELVQYTEGSEQTNRAAEAADDVRIVGKVMLVNNLVKVNMGGKTQVVCELKSEAERVAALKTYFNITLLDGEVSAIYGWDMALA
ncbi:hypothetical protein NLG97_g7656 [Lecanicillium saksenae]|uniref:Uncharacterized protein n=1 Tax=Lecanicillium saksenae TaxID=468837 RepID=A0ACC1QMG0_9HYPO|nr:hypothetical protein NLG97_g7656 [Lecanicillium saksenae]